MPIVPSIQELNHRILAHMDDHGLRTIVIYLSDLRNDPALRYDNLGDTFGDRAINLIQYCRDHLCMSQLIDLIKTNNPLILSVQQPPPDPVWDEWAQQRDTAFSVADTPAPSPAQPDIPAVPATSPTPLAAAPRPLPPGISQFELQQATMVANGLGVYGAIADLYSRGGVLANQSRFTEAIDYYQQALSASKDAGDLNAQLNILGDLATAYLSMARPADARTVAFAIREVGNTYAAQSQYPSALISLQHAYNVFVAIGDTISASSCYMQVMMIRQTHGLW